MALDFPPNADNPDNPETGDEYTDDCGNIWVYDATDNKWTVQAPANTQAAIWERDASSGTGVISPVNATDELNMGTKTGNINLNDFQEAIF
jgi:hypothetical protein